MKGIKAKRKPSKDEVDFKNRFYSLMFELDLFNKFKKTYFFNILNEENYGYYAQIYLVPGLSFEDLDNKKTIIEQNLKCLWIMKVEAFKEYAEVQIVLNPIDENMEYVNPGIKPYELYLGLSFSNKIQKNNNNDNCMFLLAGATGSGKTRFIYQILLSWILGCSPEEVEIYLSDIAKNEYIQFKDIKHVKCYASELYELYTMLGKVSSEYHRRKKIISQYREKGTATNIAEYNKICKSNKLPYCYIVIDEFSILLPDKTDSKEEKKIKEYILDDLKRISKLGRSLGMFTFIATQKTTRDEMPSILKNMSAVRISFKSNDRISSEVIMENNSAVGLPKRVAVFSLNGGTSTNYLYAPKLTIEKLKELLKPHMRKEEIKASSKKIAPEVIALSEVKITKVPPGVNAREYLKTLKNNDIREDDFIDY